MRPGATQNVAVTNGASAATPNAVASDTVQVRLCATADCWVAFGATPVAAAATGVLLPAGRPERFRVNRGDKVAGLLVSASTGTLSVTELE